MTNRPNCLIVIPARLASTRLPGKPLADIAGKPMIRHVVERATDAKIGEVLVATDSDDIYQCVEGFGAKAVMTSSAHESGSDRVFEAVKIVDPDKKYPVIVNLQGDLPTLLSEVLASCISPLMKSATDISTLGAIITDERDKNDPNVVKIIGSEVNQNTLRALYFTRSTAPYGEGLLYHHIGIYAFKRQSLERFVSLSPSPLERREKLEQLRALENDMRIDVSIVDWEPIGVDTPDDLARVRKFLEA